MEPLSELTPRAWIVLGVGLGTILAAIVTVAAVVKVRRRRRWWRGSE